jgi:putative hemolysin
VTGSFGGPLTLAVMAFAAAAAGSLLAAADAALSSLPEGRLQALAKQGSRAPDFARYIAGRTRISTRWLVARIAAICVAVAFIEDARIASSTERFGPVLSALAGAILYGTVAEIMNGVARTRPEQVAALSLRFLRPFEWLVAPIADPIAALGRFVTGRLSPTAGGADARITHTEVNWVVSEGERRGAIPNEPAEMIRNVLEFKNLTARDVMVARRGVTSIDASTALEKVIAIVAAEGHSRYPVYRETMDTIIGTLYAKDLFAVVRDQKLATIKLSELLRAPVLFVAESQPAASVLKEMRARRLHMAVVLDEFGGTSGIVTLEDVLEEIVGDIRDEYDTEGDALLQHTADGRVVADASMSLADLSAQLGYRLPSDGSFESLGGLLVHRAGRVPPVGATLDLEGMTFIVREADERRVVKVEIVTTPTLSPKHVTARPN